MTLKKTSEATSEATVENIVETEAEAGGAQDAQGAQAPFAQARAERPRSERASRRKSAIDPAALMRARARAAARKRMGVTAEAAASALEFEAAFPVPDPESARDSRTGPAQLPDFGLVERVEAEGLARTARRRPGGSSGSSAAPSAGPRPAGSAGSAASARLPALLRSALEEAADHLLGRTNAEFALVPLNPVRVMVALSGGRDSMALLDAAAKLFKEQGQALIAELRAVHVHHGIEPDADAWEAHCREECAKRRIPFECVRVRVAAKGEGIEAAAREARYRALAHHAVKNGFDIVLTAHHEDDRIETFLLQWMRGAGIEGLAAFPEARELAIPSVDGAAAVQGGSQVFLLRPWAEVTRAEIDRYVKARRVRYVEDPDNASPRFSRNRIRHEVIPLLEQVRPGFRPAAARSVALVAEAVEVLKSVAATDLERCRSEEHPSGISIFRLLELIPARQAWCLRAWLSAEGLRPISKARLEDMLRQVRETHSDATFAIRLQGHEIRRWGADLVIRESVVRSVVAERSEVVRLDRDAIALPEWGGVIEVIPCAPGEPGIARSRLSDRGARLEARSAAGAVKLRLWELRPAKLLKDLYAQAGIPAYARADLPRLWLNGELLFAAGLGMDVRLEDDPEKFPDRVRLRWHPDHSLWEDRAVPNYAELGDEERRAREERLAEANKAAVRLAREAERAAKAPAKPKRSAAKPVKAPAPAAAPAVSDAPVVQAAQIAQADQPVQPEEPVTAAKAADLAPEQAEKSENYEKSEKSRKPGKAAKAEKSVKSGKTGKAGKSAKASSKASRKAAAGSEEPEEDSKDARAAKSSGRSRR